MKELELMIFWGVLLLMLLVGVCTLAVGVCTLAILSQIGGLKRSNGDRKEN